MRGRKRERKRECTGWREAEKSEPDVFVSMRDRVHYATVSLLCVRVCVCEHACALVVINFTC